MNKKLIAFSTIIYLSAVLTSLSLDIKDVDNTISFNSSDIEWTTLDFTNILKNNLYVICEIICGAFTFGSLTVIIIISNGLYLALCIKVAIESNLDLESIILLTLPHGILEIPAIIIAGAAGFKIPYEIVRYLTGKKEQILTKEDIKEYIILALISVILVIIAAWIEANITLKIVQSMLDSRIKKT